METLQRRTAVDPQEPPSSDLKTSDAFAEALELEREKRITDIEELRLLLKEVAEQVCLQPALSAASELCSADLQNMLGRMRNELSDEISSQVSSASSALKGHVAVGCAELRGELTARLDVYESDMHQTRGVERCGQSQ